MQTINSYILLADFTKVVDGIYGRKMEGKGGLRPPKF